MFEIIIYPPFDRKSMAFPHALMEERDRIETQKLAVQKEIAVITQNLINPLWIKIQKLNDELRLLRVQFKPFQYVLIKSDKEIDRESLWKIAEPGGRIKNVSMAMGNACFLALIEFDLPVELKNLNPLPEGVIGSIELSSEAEFDAKKQPVYGADYAIWLYGEEKYNSVLVKLNLYRVDFRHPAANSWSEGKGACCLCGQIANKRNCKFYQLDSSHRYLICCTEDSCLKKLQARFNASGIIIPDKKFTEKALSLPLKIQIW
ncbi:MAG: hypothetical protein Hyperionvirus1_6 [Hyperionvirus sp.]|uniref:Uncharacterized protein n=1 Tax=Hyperionvirus sp. TaxID=2487770 RepID=A0A3G5A5C4_9VIRU|nr:MAG: hypothetical protein Hyperionvirus1_6 [Hyperionvirus sp.]